MKSVSTPLPLLPPEDQALLARYFAANEDLAKLAAEPGHPDLLSLLRWLSRPDIAAYIAAFHTHQNHLHRQSIIAALRTALASLTDPIEVRRAAATLLRALNPGRSPQPALTDTSRRSLEPRAHRATPRSADAASHRRPVSPNPADSLPRQSPPATPISPAIPAAPVPATPPLDSALARALAALGLPADLEALDRADDEAEDAELDALDDLDDDDFGDDLANSPEPGNSS